MTCLCDMLSGQSVTYLRKVWFGAMWPRLTNICFAPIGQTPSFRIPKISNTNLCVHPSTQFSCVFMPSLWLFLTWHCSSNSFLPLNVNSFPEYLSESKMHFLHFYGKRKSSCLALNVILAFDSWIKTRHLLLLQRSDGIWKSLFWEDVIAIIIFCVRLVNPT